MPNIIFSTVIAPAIVVIMVIGIILIVSIIYKERQYDRVSKIAFSGSMYRFTRGIKDGITDLFFDLDISSNNPNSLKHIIDWYTTAINNLIIKYGQINRVAFIEKDSGPVGAITLISAVIQKINIPAIIVRVRRRLPQNLIKGDLENNVKNVILVTDVFTSGGGIRIAIKKLRKHNINTKAVVFYINRSEEEYTQRVEKEIGVPFIYFDTVTKKADLKHKKKRLKAA